MMCVSLQAKYRIEVHFQVNDYPLKANDYFLCLILYVFFFVLCKVKCLRYRISKICLLYFIWAEYKCGCRFISHTNNLNICNRLSKLKKGRNNATSFLQRSTFLLLFQIWLYQHLGIVLLLWLSARIYRGTLFSCF